VHHGQYIPPDPSKGDDTTVGGYAAVHGRPAALEGRDGFSYSIEILSDDVDEPNAPPAERFGAYLMFVQWARLGAQRPEGHLETPFLTRAETPEAAERALGAMPLREAQAVLDGLLRARDGASTRRWWNVLEDNDEPGRQDDADEAPPTPDGGGRA
jgi:hypothetical protein